MYLSGFMRLRLVGAWLFALLFSMAQAPSCAAQTRIVNKAGIDKSEKMVRADLRRMFPCYKLKNYSAKEIARMNECGGSISVEQSPSSKSIDRIEAEPELYRNVGGKMIRNEPSPMYGKLMQYLFPRWKNSNGWLARKLQFIRHSGCSPIAHVDNVYVIVRHGFEVQRRIRAQLIITKSAAELADWKKLDEIFCDGPLRVEEIQ